MEGMTFSQAILMVGGLNRFGSKSKITLKRVSEGKETITQVNLGDIEKGKAKDIPLRPNDTIIVGRRVF
jgi:protein involved in polysaccharide export with SLBB domain